VLQELESDPGELPGDEQAATEEAGSNKDESMQEAYRQAQMQAVA